MIQRACVFCASSQHCDPAYHAAARQLGAELAHANIEVVYGGGAVGSMGSLADGALAAGGRVTGVLPRFMQELEWGHTGIDSLEIVDNMHQRKYRMLELSDAVIALPGGCGTFEELFEVITLKRLARYLGPIVLVNTRSYFDVCIALLQQCIEKRFMNEIHKDMWRTVDDPSEVSACLNSFPAWTERAISHAAVARAGEAR